MQAGIAGLSSRNWLTSGFRTARDECSGQTRYKYVVFNGGERPEQFFDLELDPGEVRNLVGDPGVEMELGRHRMLLGDWLVRTNDTFQIPTV